jgi:hypothetical protein
VIFNIFVKQLRCRSKSCSCCCCEVVKDTSDNISSLLHSSLLLNSQDKMFSYKYGSIKNESSKVEAGANPPIFTIDGDKHEIIPHYSISRFGKIVAIVALLMGSFFLVSRSNKNGTQSTSFKGGANLKEDTTKSTASLTVQLSIYNNGSVSCSQYCGGTNGHPWNNLLPIRWNVATCSTNLPNVECEQVAGKSILCTCIPTGYGWCPESCPGIPTSVPTTLIPTPLPTATPTALLTAQPTVLSQVALGNDGSVSCAVYCGGLDGRPWNNELPTSWNGATCSATNVPNLGCFTAPGRMPGFKCTCIPSGKGWY